MIEKNIGKWNWLLAFIAILGVVSVFFFALFVFGLAIFQRSRMEWLMRGSMAIALVY